MDGQEFKQWRESMGWGARQAGAALGVTDRQIQRWDNGAPISAAIENFCDSYTVARMIANKTIVLIKIVKDALMDEGGYSKLIETMLAVDDMPWRGWPKSAAK